MRCYYNGTLIETYPSTADGCYFKAGMYTQSKTTENGGREDKDDANAYGEVEIYNVTVTHDYNHDPSDDTDSCLLPHSTSNNPFSTYNLLGLQMRAPFKGVVIRNGRKMLAQ